MWKAPERMARLFETHAVEQYQQELLFSSQVDLMSLVVYRGMMIAIPSPYWESLRTISLTQMALLLQYLAAKVNLKRFLKSPRGTKKKREPLIVDRKHRHVSTARLLEAHQTTRKT